MEKMFRWYWDRKLRRARKRLQRRVRNELNDWKWYLKLTSYWIGWRTGHSKAWVVNRLEGDVPLTLEDISDLAHAMNLHIEFEIK